MKRPRRHEEDDLQKAVCNHLRARGVPKTLWLHPPNGGKRNAREAGRFKAMGVLSGAADLLLWRNGMSFALELKATSKGVISKSQDEFHNNFVAAGGLYGVAYGIDEALLFLELWGFLRPAVWPA
jgi:hypothetical protein